MFLRKMVRKLSNKIFVLERKYIDERYERRGDDRDIRGRISTIDVELIFAKGYRTTIRNDIDLIAKQLGMEFVNTDAKRTLELTKEDK